MLPSNPSVFRFPDANHLSVVLAQHVHSIAESAIQKHGRFLVAVSGGSLPSLLFPHLVQIHSHFAQWHVFLADERRVPPSHPDSNFLLIQRYLKGLVPSEQLYGLDPWDGEGQDVADAYMQRLMDVFAHKESVRFPVFDCILLGMGPDGHTASLFPHQEDILNESINWVVPVEHSPKPPPKRVTLSLPVINHAHQVFFVVTGSSKKETIKRVLELHDQHLPASHISPVHGQLCWFLDEDACQNLSPSFIFQN